MNNITGNSSPGRSALRAALEGAGATIAALSDPAMGEVVVVPHGGRVIGLFAGGQDDNLMWINAALGQVDTARAALNASEWVHLGGDRTWVSPERELFVGDLARDWETYRVPAPLDPGNYSVTSETHEIQWRNQATIFFNAQQRSSDVAIEKSVRLIADPLRLTGDAEERPGVVYAGYELSTSLRLVKPASGGPAMSLWNILVVPADGWAIVPVWGETRARDYFEKSPPERLWATERTVYFRLDGREQHKIGIQAPALAGRAGHLRMVDAERSTLIVRSFAVNPSGEYVDTPWHTPDEKGYAFQSYNDAGALGAFGELEYHTPAIGGTTGLDQHTDVSQVWAYAGPTAAVRRIAEQLLGADSVRALKLE